MSKKKFKSWVLNNLKDKSGAVSAYIKALEWLSDRFYEKGKIKKESIFDINDIELISKLYSEVKIIQQDKSSYIYNKHAPSYGEKYFYSASLGKYLSFLEEQIAINNNYTLKKPLSDDILLAFKKWYDKTRLKNNEDFYKKIIDFENLKNKSDNELVAFFVQFKKDGGKIQSTDNRLIDKFKKVISDLISDFREFILEPFSPEFDEQKWFDDLKKFKYFGIGTATIYLNRVDKNKYPPFNNKVREAFNIIGSKRLPSANESAFYDVTILSKKLIDVYICFDNYFQTDSFTQFIIGEDEGKYLIKRWLNDETIIDNFNIRSFSESLEKSGLLFTSKIITRYISSLATKPFVILTGLSGSGKTKLAQAFAQWISEDKSQYCIVPVGADWINREPILGYVNALKNEEYILPENGALKLIIEANKPENENKPYFLILDEMNLSHVERYFADFLSVMETKDEKFKLHSSSSPLKSQDGIEVKNGYYWPKNLFVVGTVNIDETTYMFSPKVLDRANVIEFRINETEIGEYLENSTELDMKKLFEENSNQGLGASMGKDFVNIAINKEIAKSSNHKETLKEFFVELQKVGAEFGYRTAAEIQTLLGQINVINKEYVESDRENEKIDIAIMQKLLPKLHGSRSKLVPILELLAVLCFEKETFTKEQKNDIFNTLEKGEFSERYALSLEKLTRMYHNAVSNGFTSYAEA